MPIPLARLYLSKLEKKIDQLNYIDKFGIDEESLLSREVMSFRSSGNVFARRLLISVHPIQI